MCDLIIRDLYLNAVMLHSFLCIDWICVRFVHNCLGLLKVFFSAVVLPYNINTNDFNFIMSLRFCVAIAVRGLESIKMVDKPF